MQSFLIGLQFLTRICLVRQTVWTEEGFGKSVRYFPLVGAVLGMCYGGMAFIMFNLLPHFGFYVPHHFAVAILLAMTVLLTGGIHSDGFMDTCDGVFSGRPRERMLEIMKDSRVGSFGVVGFILLLLVQYSLLLDITSSQLWKILFAMPIIGRLMMTGVIACCPCARNEGIGKMFTSYTSKKMLAMVSLYTLCLLIPTGFITVVALVAACLFTVYFSLYITRVLGGMTGDVYGAVCVLSETVVLATCLIGNTLLMNRGWM